MQGIACRDRLPGVVAAQIGVQLTIRETLSDLVCPAQCQRCLSGAGSAGYHVYRDDERTAVLAGENGVQLAELIGAVDESAYVSR
ncbi:hypothetical protein SBI_03821 [Streptomyces bingchenggensis BCW-1]|uniref:Uncharacterized protein n=1 Tax=Streptomyces bingchenggensis (strain BCW-1) TaxID=749414 RepID=D7CG34_STRBB|nr:hypothetical protein SBI_03821 [Streptomyces bingchenggensis BCW-1]